MTLLKGNCVDIMNSDTYLSLIEGKQVIVVTDPPFNIGYHYKTYKDRMKQEEYYKMLKEVFGEFPFVMIHYPENICELAIHINKAPKKVVSWVYNSNTAKQHRDVAFWDIKPDFRQVTQPYKNPNDKRIKERISRGIGGGAFI